MKKSNPCMSFFNGTVNEKYCLNTHYLYTCTALIHTHTHTEVFRCASNSHWDVYTYTDVNIHIHECMQMAAYTQMCAYTQNYTSIDTDPYIDSKHNIQVCKVSCVLRCSTLFLSLIACRDKL